MTEDHSDESKPVFRDQAALREEAVASFEAAWNAGQRPAIEDFLSVDGESRHGVLVELVHADLEFRLKAGEPVHVEDYLIRYRELAEDDETVLELIATEYRLRRRRELELNVEEYVQRFARYSDQLPARLAAEVDSPPKAGRKTDVHANAVEPTLAYGHQGDSSSNVQSDLADQDLNTRRKGDDRIVAKIRRRLGRYKLLEPLGRGGMGTVYKALHTKLGCHVAVKVMRDDLNDEPEAVARFEREMKAVGGLSHPNLVRALDADQIKGTHILVMEYIDGVDIASLLKRSGPLPVADACELIRQAAVGLHHAHEHGLVHRDIKPSNLMLTFSDPSSDACDASSSERAGAKPTVKVLDLGLAHLQQHSPDDDELTRTGQLMGTIDYIAPEQTIDPRNVDGRADVYSLGCALYQLLCGRPPFSGSQYDTVGKKLVAHTQHRPPPIQSRRPEVFNALADLLDDMLAKRPEDRIGSAAEVAEALAPIAAGHHLAALCSPSARVAATSPVEEAVVDETDHFLPAAHSETHSADHELSTAIAIGSRLTWVIGGAGLLLALVVGLAAWQIIVRITDREAVVERPDNGREAVVKIEIVMTERPPMSKVALVKNPAAIEGVRSWTIETRGHRGEVHTVRYSPDGNSMATGGEDGTVRVWDSKTGELDKALVGHDGAVQDLSWSPDSQQLASGADDDTVRVWDVPSGQQTQKTEVDNPSKQPLFVSFSPDGKALAYGGAEGVIHLWDVESGEVRELHGPKEGVRSVSWAGDGQTLVAANANTTLTVWDVLSGQARVTLEGHTGPVTDVDISPDDKTVASSAASPGADESVRLWDLATGKPKKTLPAHKHGAECIVFSPNGRLLVSGGAEGDGRLRVWNIDTGKLVYEQEPHEGTRSIASVTVSPDGNILAIAHHDGTVTLCNLDTGDPIRALPKAEQVVNVSPEGYLSDTPTDDGKVVYVAATDAGQTTSSPSGFFQLYAWTNDPQQAVDSGHAMPAENDLASNRQAEPEPQKTDSARDSDGKPDGSVVTGQSSAAAGNSVQPSIAIADDWVDVMPQIDLARDVLQGDWSRRNDEGPLVPVTEPGRATSDSLPKLCLPIDLPTGYEVKISYTIGNEHYGIVVHFPVGHVSTFVCASAGPAAPKRLPKGSVRFDQLKANPGKYTVAAEMHHHVGTPHEMTLRVEPLQDSQIRILVKLDTAASELEWVGTPEELASLGVPQRDSSRIAIMTYNFGARIANVRIRALTDEPLPAPDVPVNENLLTPADGWVDMLPQIDLARDVRQGKWSLDDERLVPATNLQTKTEDRPALCLPIDLPTGYELSLSYHISNEHYGMIVHFPVGQASQPVYTSGQPAKKNSPPYGKVVLAHINEADEGSTTAGEFSHHVGTEHVLTVQVVPEDGAQFRIHVRLDTATKELEWTATPEDLAALGVPLGDSPRIRIEAYNHAVKLKSMRIRALTDEPIRPVQEMPISD